mmetsp:Transcript_63039/g.177805  ORF Transcript_63039/g.177805 Transcript_63039/m.177805 type:complete len:299 (+) Transcript_63039:725-1621(+)
MAGGLVQLQFLLLGRADNPAARRGLHGAGLRQLHRLHLGHELHGEFLDLLPLPLDLVPQLLVLGVEVGEGQPVDCLVAVQVAVVRDRHLHGVRLGRGLLVRLRRRRRGLLLGLGRQGLYARRVGPGGVLQIQQARAADLAAHHLLEALHPVGGRDPLHAARSHRVRLEPRETREAALAHHGAGRRYPVVGFVEQRRRRQGPTRGRLSRLSLDGLGLRHGVTGARDCGGVRRDEVHLRDHNAPRRPGVGADARDVHRRRGLGSTAGFRRLGICRGLLWLGLAECVLRLPVRRAPARLLV